MAYSRDEETGSRKDESLYTDDHDISMAPQTDGEASERSPLLRPQHGRTESRIKLPKLHATRSILLTLGFVLMLTSFGDQLQESPQTRIFESIICYKYWEEHDPSKLRFPRDRAGPGAIGGVDDMWCKGAAIQDDLAMINAYATSLDGIPNLLLAVPFGWAADRWGRWPFLFMNLFQFCLRAGWTQIVAWNWQVFDLKAVWANAAFAVLGGGSPVAGNLMFVMIADVTPSEDRAAAFLRIGATNLAANVFMPPIAAWLMEINPWIPYTAGTGMMVLAVALFCVIPETLAPFSTTPNFHHQLSPSASRPPTPTADTAGESPDLVAPASSRAQRWCRSIKSSLSFLLDDWRVPTLISTFLIHILLASITRLLLQYLSARYRLSLAKATLIVTTRNCIIVLLLFIILPYLSTWTMRVYGLCGQQKDLYLARASQLLITTGWLLVALSPNVPLVAVSLAIASLGHGSSLLIRSLLTSLLSPHHIATAYSMISVTDTLGNMLGAPILAGLFARGLALGGAWVGLPFFFVALLAAFFTGTLFLFRLEGKKNDDLDREEPQDVY